MDKRATVSFKVDVGPRFSEVDAMGIVWHGAYVQYLELAREAFGKHHGMGYMDVHRHGLMLPVVQMDLNYKAMVRYEDNVEIRVTLLDDPAAKLVFTYELLNTTTGKVCATAKTTQVFVDLEGELQLTAPQVFLDWKASLPWQPAQ